MQRAVQRCEKQSASQPVQTRQREIKPLCDTAGPAVSLGCHLRSNLLQFHRQGPGMVLVLYDWWARSRRESRNHMENYTPATVDCIGAVLFHCLYLHNFVHKYRKQSGIDRSMNICLWLIEFLSNTRVQAGGDLVG